MRCGFAGILDCFAGLLYAFTDRSRRRLRPVLDGLSGFIHRFADRFTSLMHRARSRCGTLGAQGKRGRKGQG